MSTSQDFGALPKRRLTTYGKAIRKHSQAPATNSRPNPSTTTRRPSPSSDDYLFDPESIDMPTSQARRAPDYAARKRKLSQIYAPKSRSSGPSLPGDGQSTATKTPVASSVVAGRSRSASPDDEKVDAARPDSPPPTPTPPRPARATADRLSERRSSLKTKKEQFSTEEEVPAIPPRRLSAQSEKQEPPTKRPTLASSKPTKPLLDVQSVVSTGSGHPQSAQKRPRKRLVDALVRQRKDEPNSDDPDRETAEAPSQESIAPTTMTVPETPLSRPKAPEASSRARTFTRSSSALKFTYGQGLTVLEEEDNLLDAFVLSEETSAPLKGRRLDFQTSTRITAAGNAEDIDNATSSPRGKIRNIHELRQAGAHNRAADDMSDLSDQIGQPSPGKPSSARRSALTQLAQKIKDKSYIRKCRDHGIEEKIFFNMGIEEDLVCSFLILSILTTIVTKMPSAHLIGLLQEQDVGSLLARVLSHTQDVRALIRDRKSNLSKRSQSAIFDIQGDVLALSTWESHGTTSRPPSLTLRTMALRALHLLVAQDPRRCADTSILPPVVTSSLFNVLIEANDRESSWAYPDTVESFDLVMTLSVLECHAVVSSRSASRSEGSLTDWVTAHLSTIADLFGTSLRKAASGSPSLENSILRLTINMTNNQFSAADVFVGKDLLPALVGSVCRNFEQVLLPTSQTHLDQGVLDSLLLRLGIIINFAEHSALVRVTVYECNWDGHRPITELARLFLDNHRKTAEADSVEKTHLNVSFGYLSVLLGYVALHPPARKHLKLTGSQRFVVDLIESLREFVRHLKKIDGQHDIDSEDTSTSQSDWRKLEILAQQLEREAIYD